jgi:hypothetical protein
MLLRFTAVLALVCSIASPAVAQTSSTRIILDRDIRFFTVAAALDVARFGDDSKFGTGLDTDLVQRLKQYYAAHKGGKSDESVFGQYMGLAISVTDPPELKPKFREEQLPDETRALLSFPALLQEFYLKAHLSQRWVELKPQYDAELRRLQSRTTEVLLQTDAFLRTVSIEAGKQVLHIDSELAAPANSVNMRVLLNDYFVLLGPSSATGPNASSSMDAVRHSYLHFYLDDLVNRNLARIGNKDKLLALVANEPGTDPVYTREFGLMAVESLIRAVELRMDRATAVRAKEIVANSYRSGLLLTPYFYDALQSYQSGTSALRDSYVQMATGIDLATERSRFQTTFQSIPVPQRSQTSEVENLSVPAVPVDPVHDLIVEAQTAYNSMDNDGARALFEKVLREYDPNSGSALYGLGLLASRAADVEQSQSYFERTVRSNSADPSMKVWSYIYLGHIADLQCQRERATEYYRQAVQVGDNSRDAQASAKSGLNKAFGEQCR